MLKITKIQILKVIHNNSNLTNKTNAVVENHKDTNFESNSQRGSFSMAFSSVVENHKDTNFESNSQQAMEGKEGIQSC